MKILLLVLGFVFLKGAFAAQTETLCPFMKESTERVNPKVDMYSVKAMQIKKGAVRK